MESVGAVTHGSPSAVSATEPHIASSRWLTVLATAVLTSVVVGALTWVLRPALPTAVLSQFSIVLPEGQSFSGTTLRTVAISPDGTQIAYAGNGRVYIRPIGDLEPRVIQGSEVETGGLGVSYPMFAPDGKSIAFFTGSGVGGFYLKRIPVSGGAATTLATLEIGETSASWGPGGILLGGFGGIRRVSANGGTPERIVEVGADEEAAAPQMLPDERTVLFTLAKRSGSDRWDKAQIVAHSLTDRSRRVLMEGASDARYLPTGHMIVAVAGTVYAKLFDPRTLTLNGAQVPVVIGVRRAAGGNAVATHLDVSDNGNLVYRPGPATPSSTLRGLVLGDGRQDPVPLKVPPAMYQHPRVSPDGKTLAVSRLDGTSSDIWLYDLSGQTEMRRLTFGGATSFPIWSADSLRVTYQSSRDGDRGLWWQFADGRDVERLTKANKEEAHQPESWSPDGKHLLYSVFSGSTYTLWVYSVDRKTSEPFGKVQSAETLSATYSPDGRWVAYAFTERAGGTASPNRGVFVEPFPSTGEKHQTPKTTLDYHPVWARDGASVLYLPGASRTVVSVPITTRPSVRFGTPLQNARAPFPALLSLEARGYDVMPGGRFVSVALGIGDGNSTQGNEIRIALNWFEELKRLVPAE
jgi:Tol biopolymer transport system component